MKLFVNYTPIKCDVTLSVMMNSMSGDIIAVELKKGTCTLKSLLQFDMVLSCLMSKITLVPPILFS